MPMLADSIRQFALALIVAALIVAMLVLGRSVLVPLAGAIILTFMLLPIVRWLVQRGFPRGLAVGTVLTASVGLVMALALLFSAEMLSLTVRLEDYRENIVAKARSIAAVGQGEGIIGRAAQAFDRISESITREISPIRDPASQDAMSSHPIAVRNIDDNRSLLTRLQGIFEPVAGIGLATLFTLFLLMQHEDLRDRIVRILGTDHLSDTTSAMSEAGSRLSQLFLAQATLNSGYAILVGIVLWVVAVPGAIVWAMLAGLMRFIPFIGSFVAAAPPVALAAGVSPGWGLFVFTLAFFITSEMIMGHLVEPLAIGRHVGLSAFAMVAAASFWTLVWGPVGLLLAAPITIVAVVIGRYLPGLAFLSVLLGDEPALTENQTVYQRLLAGDALAVAERLDATEDASDRAAVADTVVLPALQLAAADLQRQNLSDRQIELLRETLHEAVSLAHDETAAEDGPNADGIVVVGARGPIDAMAAAYLARVLQSETGRHAFASARDSGLTALAAAHAADGGMRRDAIIIVSTGSASARQIEYVERRARGLYPGSRVLINRPKQVAQAYDVIEPSAIASAGARTSTELVALLKLGSDSQRAAGPQTHATAQPAALTQAT